MTEDKKKAPAKKAAAAKAERKEAPKAAPKAAKPAATKAPAAPKQPKAAYAGAKLKVMQVASPIGRTRDQEGTLIGLGLNKMNRTRELPDTAETRGMIAKVKHLVKIVASGS